jgi:hypothetical protein
MERVMPKGIYYSHLISGSEEEAVKAFARKMVTRISVTKGRIMAGECVKVHEETEVQMLDH